MVARQPSPDPDKRARILRAAWTLIRQYGYAKTTMGEIAAEAGIGKGTAYLYFRSKADIMLALTEETNRRILEQLRQIAAGEGDPVRRLREVMVHRVRAIESLVRRHPHGEEVVRSIKPDIVRRIHGTVLQQGRIAADLIREGNAAGVLAVDDPDAAGLHLAELFERFTPPYDHVASSGVVEFAERTFDLILHGMRAPGAPPPQGEPS